MMEGDSLGDVAEEQNNEFINMIFSWSLDDIFNKDLYKYKVESIPLTFESEEHYFGSFVYPLLEETHAELASSMEIMYRAPFAEILSFSESKCGENMVYDVSVGPWKNQFYERGKEAYQTLPGDVLIIVDGKPESVSDLQRVGRTWALSSVKSNEDDSTSLTIKVKASKPIEFQDGMFVVFVMNITTQKTIWNSLHIHRNLNIIKEVLYSHSAVKESCDICSTCYDSTLFQKYDSHLLVNLNENQKVTIMAALSRTQCCHFSSVEQIRGPPGTGKTMTVSVLLFILSQVNHRTLVCAPTNVAIIQLASRVLSLVRESFKITTASGDYFCPVGDVVLFGTKERLNVSTDIEEIFLEYRVKRLVECLGPVTGWKHCIRSMIDVLENCVSEYHVLLKNKKQEVKSFKKFVRGRFSSCATPLRRCIVTFCTHIPRSFIGEYNFKNMISLLDNLSSLESLLFHENLVSEELRVHFTSKPLQEDIFSISFIRAMSLSVLTTLQLSLDELTLPSYLNKYAITQFCFERASVILCTTSSSYKLHGVNMEPLDILVIDEAAQLKEAESIIPLQLPGLKHVILIGEEQQLPAVCIETGLGRSLFDRLSSLGHSKHPLNVQYRMHHSLSVFLNQMFYQNQIQDAAELARSLGDVIKEADCLEKAGQFKEATVLVIWYVLLSSLWGNGNEGWPLKQFPEKEELCNKVKPLAKQDSYKFYDFVCNELNVLSDQHTSLTELKKDLDASRKNKSLRGEIFSLRKILDAHFRLNSSEYEWEDELPVDINKHCEDQMFHNRVSVRTLVYYWNLWKENVCNIFHNEEPNKHDPYFEFCLFYFGVRRHHVNGNTVYQLVNKDAHWIQNTIHKGLRRYGECLTMDIKDLVLAFHSYWQSKLLSVGVKVLETLEGLHHLNANGSAFHQGISLLHIYDVSNFLFSCKYLDLTPPFDVLVASSLKKTSEDYFDLVFPLDWRRSLSEDLIALRTTDLSVSMLHEIILRNVDIKGDLDDWRVGRVMMTCLGSKTAVELYECIINKLELKPIWKLFVGKLRDVGHKENLVLPEFMLALNDAFRANRLVCGYISPDSFVRLLERLLFVASWFCQTFYTAKSSFAGWFADLHSNATPTTFSPKPEYLNRLTSFYVEIVQKILYNRKDTFHWCRLLVDDWSMYHQILALKLVMMLALILLEEPDYSQVLLDLLMGSNNIADLLPEEFVSSLLRRREGHSLNLNPEVVAEAFLSVEDPLVIVCAGELSPKIHVPRAIFVDLNKSEEEIMRVLFPR